MMPERREFLKLLAATAALYGCSSGVKARGHVVVIGGGFGGATAAKYLRMWSNGSLDVTLIERNPEFISCPISNLVVAGEKTLADITTSYDGLKKWGVRVVQDEVTGLTAEASRVKVQLARGGVMHADRAVVSPGIDFNYADLPGLNSFEAQAIIPHAWKAGPQTLLLRDQMAAMKDGGVVAITIPKAPYRCPPGPYERACLIAHYLKTAKPRSKVLILDANEDIVSKKGLFLKAWETHYKGMIEYRPNAELRDVDAANRTAVLEFDSVKADVLNVIPPQRAGAIAHQAGLVTANARWCGIDWLTMESLAVKRIHVLGDATLAAPAMPKSGHMANQHAKLAAAAIISLQSDTAPNPAPVVMNTCYSFVDAKQAIHVASVHQYDAAERTLKTVPGSGGVSAASSEMEGTYAMGWAKNIWADALGY
ncbi:MAG: hypothetical protein RIR70_544 [Pseudomonadota bacterium]|jgi:sulfite dehydrogenase